MKKSGIFVILTLMVMVLFGCGPKLENEEAKKIIVEKFGYPILEYTHRYVYPEQQGKNWDMVREFVSEGMVKGVKSLLDSCLLFC